MPRSFERGLCPRNPRGEASEGGRSPPPRTWCAAGCRDRPHDTLCRARSSSALARATLRGGYRRGGGAPLRGHGAPQGPCSPGMSGPRRSFHFVPGGNEKMIAKALTLPADALILDLEDAVTVEKKAEARGIVFRWLQTLDFGGRERWVRMNPLATGFGEADLDGTIGGKPDGYVVPKPRSAADIRAIASILDRLGERHGVALGSTALLLVATETPGGRLKITDGG